MKRSFMNLQGVDKIEKFFMLLKFVVCILEENFHNFHFAKETNIVLSFCQGQLRKIFIYIPRFT